MKESSYPEAKLPAEMQDMQDGEEVEKVCTVKRKGDQLCIVSCQGIPLSSHVQLTEPPDKEEEEGEDAYTSPSQFMAGKFAAS